MIPVGQPLHWLLLGLRDMVQSGWLSIAHGAALALFGAVRFSRRNPKA